MSLFNLYTESIIHVEELAGLNIKGRIINHLRYADNLSAENEQESQDLVDQQIETAHILNLM